jgi:5-methylcytosine-specific restriction endonuclease McrA
MPRDKAKYPSCWPKVSRIIRRLANGHCEYCKKPVKFTKLSTHHVGIPYANKPGGRHDKHDIRRENLAALCRICHIQADAI